MSYLSKKRKNMRLTRWRAIAGLILTTLVSASASTPKVDTKDAPPGTLTCVIGEAWIGSQPLNEKSAGSAALSEGQLLRTGNGAVEIILAPGVFLRVGRESSLRMTSLNPINLGVEVRQGHAIIEVGERRKANAIRVLEHDATAQLLKKGLYEFDAELRQFLVFKGEVVVQQGNTSVVATSGRRVTRNFSGEMIASKFNKRVFERSDLHRFSSMRAKYLAEVNASLWESYYWPGWRGSGQRGGGLWR
jgi:hypothetical protein